MKNRFSDKSDDTLVELTLLGEEYAYEELVVRHERSVKGTAYKVTGNRFSADDASQDAFVSAWMHLASLKDPTKFGAWVCSIAKNSAYALLRHYRSAVPNLSLNLEEYENVPDGADDFSDWEDRTDLHHAVDALSEKVRDTVRLHYFENLSVREIAEQLGISEGTVKWRLSEGRKQLRKGYGLMENTYNENESMVKRVMRQVEELKLWQLRRDKSGFEEDYRRVLDTIETLEDSVEKSHALADVYQLGRWWLKDGDKEDLFEKIKEHALRGHNDDVMQTVVAVEHDRLEGRKKIDYMLNQQIPFLAENSFNDSLAYVWFWLGRTYTCSSTPIDYEKGMDAYRNSLALAPESNVYHALSKAALYCEEKVHEAKAAPGTEDAQAGPTGENYRFIDGRLYFWNEPGYNPYSLDYDHHGLLYNASQCDSLLLDPEMKVGERKVAAGGEASLTYTQADAAIDTPAGRFENVSVFVCETKSGNFSRCTTYFCPGVGIVAQQIVAKGKTYQWFLSEYQVTGDGLLPLAVGNRWDYVTTPANDTREYSRLNRFEVVYNDGGSVNLAGYYYIVSNGFRDTWAGQTAYYRNRYYREIDENKEELNGDILPVLDRAMELAETKRQKVHTKVAAEVMRRIFTTDKTFNPDHTEVGRWNFFDYLNMEKADGRTTLSSDWHYSFEWKELGGYDLEGSKLFYNDLYEFLPENMDDCIWSEEWTDGYFVPERKFEWVGDPITEREFRVQADGTVETPAGVFENCLKISYTTEGRHGGLAYRSGYFEYWFAPGVGIVKFQHPLGNDGENLWQLTSYTGVGEGYFPIGDGFRRKYEPKSICGGWRASVEYTFVTDEAGTVIFKNALGTQARAEYEKSKAK